MLDVNDLKSGALFIYNDDPCVILWSNHLKMQQRRPVMQTKMRNLRTGQVFEHNFHQGDTFEEADITKKGVMFLFEHRGAYTFCEKDNPKNRFTLAAEAIGEPRIYLKPNTEVEALYFGEELLTAKLPIKVDLKVVEAPPSIRGDTAQGGTKTVKLETGATVNTPLFIEEGDTVRVNTESSQYVERVEKRG